MDIRIINDQTECYSIWNSIVDIKTLYDEWDFRLAFYNSANPLHFITIFEDGIAVALLPLQNNTIKGYYEFWGGNFMENNRIFTKPGFEHLRSTLIESLPSRTILRCITPEDSIIQNLPIDDYTYNLNISGFSTIDDYFNSCFKSKTKQGFKRKLKKFASIPHSIEYNRIEDISRMIELNIRHFGPESSLGEINIAQAFPNLLSSKFKITILSVILNGIAESITYSIEYKDMFYYLISGTNRDCVTDLGNYAVLKTLEYALNNNFKTFDAGRNDCNWKERWKLEKHPLHIFKNFE